MAHEQGGPHCGDVAQTSLARRHGRARRLARRGQGGLDLLAWGRKYLPDHFRRPPSNMHRWLAEQLDAAHDRARHEAQRARPARRRQIDHRHARLAAPRGRGMREPYIWIVSDTKHQACAHLENIKAELLENQRWPRTFPTPSGRGPVWRRQLASCSATA